MRKQSTGIPTWKIGVALVFGIVFFYQPVVAIGLAVIGYLIYRGAESPQPAEDERNNPTGKLRSASNGSGNAFRENVGDGVSDISADWSVRKLTAQPDALWVPPGKVAEILGRTIPNGMVYVGQGLAGKDTYEVEAALIDPKLTVAAGDQDLGTRQLDYWPAYGRASPEARAAYLQWLAGGKKDPEANIGYVFLYYYGLERRALVDTTTSVQARAELPVIQSEIRRLLSIYCSNHSFNNYANSLLEYLDTPDIHAVPSEPPTCARSSPSLVFKVGLAYFAMNGKPLPASWALAWIRVSDAVRLRTAATRCPDEFDRIFTKEYAAKFGEGMTLPHNKTRIKVTYHHASPTISHANNWEKVFDLPDVTVLTSPMKKLEPVIEQATGTLDRFSRQIGKNPAAANSADALIHLPVEFWPQPYRETLEGLRDVMQKTGLPMATSFAKLREKLPGNWAKVTRGMYIRFAESLASIGLGIEPDSRFGGKHPASDDSHVILFADADVGQFTEPTAEYAAATLCLHLAMAVSAADGEIHHAERELLMSQLEGWLHLPMPARSRLQAHMRLLTASPPGLNALKKRVEQLTQNDRQTIGDFLAQVAMADDEVSTDEVKILEKIYKLLGLDAQSLYGKLHAIGPAAAPVTVKKGDTGRPDFAIPPKPTPKGLQTEGVVLDMDRIAALHAESEQVSGILGTIFADEGGGHDAASVDESDPDDVGPADAPDNSLVLMGLDAEYSDLVRLLITRDTWDRTELEEIATDRGIMLDGALEHVNEAALDAYDEMLIEDADPLEINRDIILELTQ